MPEAAPEVFEKSSVRPWTHTVCAKLCVSSRVLALLVIQPTNTKGLQASVMYARTRVHADCLRNNLTLEHFLFEQPICGVSLIFGSCTCITPQQSGRRGRFGGLPYMCSSPCQHGNTWRDRAIMILAERSQGLCSHKLERRRARILCDVLKKKASYGCANEVKKNGPNGS